MRCPHAVYQRPAKVVDVHASMAHAAHCNLVWVTEGVGHLGTLNPAYLLSIFPCFLSFLVFLGSSDSTLAVGATSYPTESRRLLRSGEWVASASCSAVARPFFVHIEQLSVIRSTSDEANLVETTPYKGQKPGTLGLRKKVGVDNTLFVLQSRSTCSVFVSRHWLFVASGFSMTFDPRVNIPLFAARLDYDC